MKVARLAVWLTALVARAASTQKDLHWSGSWTVCLSGALRLSVSCLLASGPLVGASHAQKVAFTFDDLPAHSSLPPGVTRQQVAASILGALKAARLPPVMGFVNGVRLQEQPDTEKVLNAWRAAGYPLANHSWSHMNLNENDLEATKADIERNEPLLKQKMGATGWQWFRYPNLAEGNTPAKRAGMRSFLAARGYKVAGVTMSFGDYAWNTPFAQCSAKGDAAAVAELERTYLAAAAESIDDSRAKSQALFHRDIPYVLLMHIGAFDARMLPRLLALYRERGFTFVTLAEAEEDPFYKTDTDLSSDGPDTLDAAMVAKHLSLPAIKHVPLPAASLCK